MRTTATIGPPPSRRDSVIGSLRSGRAASHLVLRRPRLHLAMMRGFRLELLARARLAALALHDELEEERHEEDREEGGREHAAHDAGTDPVPGAGPGAAGERQRRDSKDECERGHEDGAEAQPR